jgi:GDPmannose 4,6-dehydratase
MPKKALITGVTGQDGAYLSKLLLEKGYEVYGSYRRSSTFSFSRLQEIGIYERIHLVEMDLLEFSNVLSVMARIEPDEVYNLAAQSFVGTSFEQPIYTAEANSIGTARLLESIRSVNPEIRFYQASTSEMYGKVQAVPQCETTPFYPRSPYGVAKLYAHWFTVNYRESYGMHACSGILFNHESPLRGREFVTRKITSELALMQKGRELPLEIGNFDAKRDWGFSGDYVYGMWLMLQQEKADDYVLATGEMHSVREFVEAALPHYGFDVEWQGEDKTLTAIERHTGRVIVRVNPKFYRPAEVDQLLGNPIKAETALGWKKQVGFTQLVEMMARADIDKAAKGLL